MSRNGSGTMSVINTFVAENTITAAGHNQNNADIATELTNSMAADGQTTATAPLKHSSGTFAAPSVTFGADTDTGFYRSAANEIGWAVGGASGGLLGTATAFFGTDVALGGRLAVSATATFAATANLALGFIASATANFVTGFIASATCTFAGVVLASATAVFTTRPTAVASPVVVRSDVAAQSDQETASSTTAFVTPGRQQFHPSALKARAYVVFSGGTPSIADTFNVASVTDNGVGDTTLNLTTAFSSANYTVVPGIVKLSTTGVSNTNYIEVAALTTTTIRIKTYSVNVSGANTVLAAADIDFSVMAAGDQ